jgi:hypothetical protein
LKNVPKWQCELKTCLQTSYNPQPAFHAWGLPNRTSLTRLPGRDCETWVSCGLSSGYDDGLQLLISGNTTALPECHVANREGCGVSCGPATGLFRNRSRRRDEFQSRQASHLPTGVNRGHLRAVSRTRRRTFTPETFVQTVDEAQAFRSSVIWSLLKRTSIRVVTPRLEVG